jgi:hypothetical protein
MKSSSGSSLLITPMRSLMAFSCFPPISSASSLTFSTSGPFTAFLSSKASRAMQAIANRRSVEIAARVRAAWVAAAAVPLPFSSGVFLLFLSLMFFLFPLHCARLGKISDRQDVTIASGKMQALFSLRKEKLLTSVLQCGNVTMLRRGVAILPIKSGPSVVEGPWTVPFLKSHLTF